LDFQFRDAQQPDRAPLWRTHGELPARLQDRRPDLAARRLRGRRAADADRPRHLTLGRRVGDEQLAGHRQLLRQRQGGAVDALRRAGSDGLLRHGEASARAPDRAGAAVLIKAAMHSGLRRQSRTFNEKETRSWVMNMTTPVLEPEPTALPSGLFTK